MADRKFNQKREDASNARDKGKVTRAVGTTRGPGMNSQPPSMGLGRSTISNASFERYPVLPGNRISEFDGNEWHVPEGQHDDIKALREKYGKKSDYYAQPRVSKPIGGSAISNSGFNAPRGEGRIVKPKIERRYSISYVNPGVNSKFAPGTSQMLVGDAQALDKNVRPVVIGNRTAGPTSAKQIGQDLRYKRQVDNAILTEQRLGPLNAKDKQTAAHLRASAKSSLVDSYNQADDYVNAYQAKQAGRMRDMMASRRPKPEVPTGMRTVNSRGETAASAASNMAKYQRSRDGIADEREMQRVHAGLTGGLIFSPLLAAANALNDDRAQRTYEDNVKRRRDDASDMGPVKGRALERKNQFEGGRPKTTAELNQEKDVATMKKNGTTLTKALVKDAKK